MAGKASVRPRRMIGDYINVGGDGAEKYAFMGAGFTALNEAPTAQTSSKRYISDKSATKRVTAYDWTQAFEADQIREEEAVNYIVNIGERQFTGTDAETDVVKVDLERPVVGEADTYFARKFRAAIEVAEFPDNDGEVGATGNFLGIGDPIIGSFNTVSRTFTAGEPDVQEKLIDLSVTSAAGTAAGNTKLTVTPSLGAGRSYKTKTGASVVLPTLNEVLTTGWQAWDGSADITATSGQKIVVAEVDADNKCKAAGMATVTAKA